MIVVEQASPLLLAIFLICMLAAAAVDVRTRQVPNLLAAAAALSGIAAFVSIGQAGLLWQPLLVALAVMAAGTVMFSRNWVGGGDVKLLAAASSWFTAAGALQFLSSVFLAGGALALVAIGLRRARGRRASRQSQAALPYAVAIAAGAIVQVLLARF